MADSANILSILSMLAPSSPPPGADAPDVQLPNVLQAAQPAPQLAPPPVVTQAPPAPAPVAEHPTKRRSLLDTIGRISDVIAKVGGADALYQPTLDAREDRSLALGDHARKVSADEIALATSKFDLGDKQNTRLGQAMRGLKAIQTAGGDVNAAWPELARRMQIDDATAQSIGAHLAQNPSDVDGLIAAMTDPKLAQSHYGGSVVYARGADGKIHAYQPSLADDPARDILPEGVEAIDPPKSVDLGGSVGLVGTRSGNVNKVLPKSQSPDNAANNKTRITVAGMDNKTRMDIAGMKPGNKPLDNSAFISTAQGNLDELKGIYGTLHKMGALVSPAQSMDKNVIARIRASGIGQTLEGAAGTQAQTQRDRIASIRPQLMQSLAKATGMTGKQLDSNADVKLFMQTVTDPTKSYEANMEAIAGLERFLKANAKKPAAAAAPSPSPRRPQPKSGWTIVKVQ